MRNLNLDQLEALREVVALGSFSAAAERLNLTQPAISLQIKQLEARLGIRLVERIGKRAFATAAGRDILARARRHDQSNYRGVVRARRYRSKAGDGAGQRRGDQAPGRGRPRPLDPAGSQRARRGGSRRARGQAVGPRPRPHPCLGTTPRQAGRALSRSDAGGHPAMWRPRRGARAQPAGAYLTAVCSIAPKIELPAGASVSGRPPRPKPRNRAAACPLAIVSIMRRSARQDEAALGSRFDTVPEPMMLPASSSRVRAAWAIKVGKSKFMSVPAFGLPSSVPLRWLISGRWTVRPSQAAPRSSGVTATGEKAVAGFA